MATTINLLPWRAELREQRKKEFFAITGGFAAMGVVVFLVWLMALSSLIEYQESRNGKLKAEIATLDKRIAEVDELKKQKAEMVERMKIIRDLQGTRPVIVHIFDDLVKKQPDGLFYTKIEKKDKRIVINGTAESNNRVSTLMKSFSESDWFQDPNLTKVEANAAAGEQGTNFNLSVDVVPMKQKSEGDKK